MYRGRADGENRIKELKYDFAADSFNMKDFWATEATLNTVMLAYNLMSLLRQVLLKTSTVKHSSNTVQHTLQTLRYQLFAKPAYIITESRKSILNLAIAMQQRARIQGLWDAAKAFDLPATFAPLHPSGLNPNGKSRFKSVEIQAKGEARDPTLADRLGYDHAGSAPHCLQLNSAARRSPSACAGRRR